MQGLWSRTAQTKLSSQCCTHLHSATALARQSAKPTKRKVTVGDLLTACYSTLLATAAVADARIKAERRKEWDVAIARIKTEIPTYDSNEPSQAIAQVSDINTGGQESHGANHQNGEHPNTPKTTPLNFSRFDPNTPTTHYIPLGSTPRISSSSMHEVSIESKEGSMGEVVPPISADNFIPRKPRSKGHLRQMEDTIRNLVDNLLRQSSLPLVDEGTITSPSIEFEAQKTELVQLLKESRDAFFPLPTYRRHHDIERLEKLHIALNTLFAKAPAKSAQVNELVSKICHNLLISPAPPSVETYHTLILGFWKLEQHALAQTVIDSFFNDSKLKASEQTAKLLLDYYIATGDSVRFRGIVQRMRGVNGDMHIKRKTVYELSRGPDVRRWALQNKVIHRGAYLHQKMDRTVDIFESLIRGSLLWDGPPGAVRLVRAAIREGQKICSQTIFRVIDECVARLDYRSGLKLLDGILSNWEDGAGSSITEYSPDNRYRLGRLLAVCGVDPSSDLPRTMLPIPSSDALPSMLRWMELKSISDHLACFADNILSISSALEAPQADTYTKKTIQGCLTLLQNSSQAERLRSSEDQKNIAECRLIRERATALRTEAKGKCNKSAKEESDRVKAPRNQNSDDGLEHISIRQHIISVDSKNLSQPTHFPHPMQNEALQLSQPSPP